MKRILAFLLAMMMMMPVTVRSTDVEDELWSAPLFDESESNAMETALEEFNEKRAHIGLGDMTISDTLIEMAQYHAKYMAYNNKLTSIEESDEIYFRGRYPWDRAVYFKYDMDYVYEFVEKDAVNYLNGMDDLINDPVTRYFMLDPMYSEIGMGVEDDYFTFLLGGGDSSYGSYIRYPYSAQEDVPVVWSGESFDELYEGLELESEAVGLPITIAYYSDTFEDFTNIQASLLNKDTNRWVEVEVIEPGEHYLMTNALTILPLEPYEYGTDYQVHLSMDRISKNGNVNPYKNTYKFTTESSGSDPEVSSPYITRGDFTERLIRNLGYTLTEPLEPIFSDVSMTSFAGRYIYTAYYEGLINGFSENKFRPELNITREQAYVIFVRAYEKSGVDSLGNRVTRTIEVEDPDRLDYYKDERKISPWAYDYILKATELGIVMDEISFLHPDDYLTQDDFQWMLERYQSYIGY